MADIISLLCSLANLIRINAGLGVFLSLVLSIILMKSVWKIKSALVLLGMLVYSLSLTIIILTIFLCKDDPLVKSFLLTLIPVLVISALPPLLTVPIAQYMSGWEALISQPIIPAVYYFSWELQNKFNINI